MQTTISVTLNSFEKKHIWIHAEAGTEHQYYNYTIIYYGLLDLIFGIFG